MTRFRAAGALLVAASCVPDAPEPRAPATAPRPHATAPRLPDLPPDPGTLEPVGDDEPATRAAGRVLGVLDRIEERLATTRYQHTTKVRERQGLYAWDCSGMAAWVLDRSAPKALAALGRGRPVARDFYRAIERAPTDKPRRGWQRLDGIEDARPGDVFAWLRPPDLPRDITGHVGFLLEAPRRVPGVEGAYVVRIADSTRLPHGEDTRARGGDGGYGSGTLLFLTDENGVTTRYGWFGLESRGFIATQVLFGRVSR